jgi:hypothetical protein
MFRRFTQRAARKEMLVAKGGFPVDENKIEAPVKLQVLKPVIKDQQVASEGRYGMSSAFDPVLVDDDGHPAEVFCQHERLVSRGFGIEENGPSLRDHPEMCFFHPRPPPADAFVSTAQDGNASSAGLEIAGQFFNHGSLACASDGQVSDADHGASDLMPPQEMCREEAQPQDNNRQIEIGDRQKNGPENSGTFSRTTLQDHVNCELLKTVEETAHCENRVKLRMKGGCRLTEHHPTHFTMRAP